MLALTDMESLQVAESTEIPVDDRCLSFSYHQCARV